MPTKKTVPSKKAPPKKAAAPSSKSNVKAPDKKKAVAKKEPLLPKIPVAAVTGLPSSDVSEIITNFPKFAVTDFIPDPIQPRKFFDPVAQAELEASIKEKDVYTPILARPLSVPLPENGPKYKLVYGERRWRAKSAVDPGGMIPAIIRIMSDEEALEAQIIENLQRRDIKAMEEAVSFKSLRWHLDGTDRMPSGEIAIRVGKSVDYVIKRIKLNDLLPEFQDILFSDRMLLADAMKLCRFSPASQTDIFNGLGIPGDWKTMKDWRVKDYTLQHLMSNEERDLGKAPFSISDASLYPEAGACTKCPHNSANNKTLFDDLNKKKVCHNGPCFAVKKKRGYEKNMLQLSEDKETVFVSTGHFRNEEEKEKIKIAEDLGISIIADSAWTPVAQDDPPGTLEDYIADQREYYDEEDDGPLEKCIEDWTKDYEGEVEEYEAGQKELAKAREGGLMKKAFVVTGWNEGKTIDIMLKPSKSASSDGSPAGDDILASARADAEAKEKRAKEIDNEKVFDMVMPAIKEYAPYRDSQNELLPVEYAGLVLMILERAGHEAEAYLEKCLGRDISGYNDAELFCVIQMRLMAGDTKIFLPFMRRALMYKFSQTQSKNFAESAAARFIYETASHYIPQEVAEFNATQDENAIKRQERRQKKLQALERSITKQKIVSNETP